jgi:hypothetical protein
VVPIADPFRPIGELARGASIETVFIRFRRWNLAERPFQLFRAHALRIGIWLCMQGFFIRSGQILPTHFTTGRDDRFEILIGRFRRWNPLGRIQCPKRGANPQGLRSSATEVRFGRRQILFPLQQPGRIDWRSFGVIPTVEF